MLEIKTDNGLISTPTKFLSAYNVSTAVVPDPTNGSKTTSPTFVNSLIAALGIAGISLP